MNRKTLTAVVAILALAAGCDRPTATRLRSSPAAPSQQSSAATLVECPVDSTVSTSGVITSLGGTLALAGTSVTLPAGAVLVPTIINVTIPASRYMEVDVSVPGVEHFFFQLPVSVTLDYSRCTRSNIDNTPLSVWNIDPLTNALLQNMGGTDDKTARQVTFSTNHLSGYAIAD